MKLKLKKKEKKIGGRKRLDAGISMRNEFNEMFSKNRRAKTQKKDGT